MYFRRRAESSTLERRRPRVGEVFGVLVVVLGTGEERGEIGEFMVVRVRLRLLAWLLGEGEVGAGAAQGCSLG